MTEPATQVVFAGIDTHKVTHHAAVIDADGRRIADREFTTGSAGCRALIDWLGQWQVERVGVEQTGTYGAGLTRLLDQGGYQVFDVNTPDPAVRATVGKSDPIDAVMAADAVRTGRAQTVAKDRSGVIESIRMLQIARASAVKARTAALTQIGDLATTLDGGLRARLGSSNRQIAATALSLRPDRARLHDPTQAAKVALRSIAARIRDLDTEINDLDAALAQLVGAAAPRLLARPQVGIHAAAQLLITAGQNPDRIATEAAFARLTGVAPIPASSGQTRRMRLHRGGDRQANKTIHMIAVGRLKNHQPAIDYLERRLSEGLSKKDAIRAMKRLIARELHGALKADLKALDAL
ncbi:IS110 family transposase [Aeromicrobium camelliae]|nr:IS110 family transposase [Aeromicrobium camelliae]